MINEKYQFSVIDLDLIRLIGWRDAWQWCARAPVTIYQFRSLDRRAWKFQRKYPLNTQKYFFLLPLDTFIIVVSIEVAMRLFASFHISGAKSTHNNFVKSTNCVHVGTRTPYLWDKNDIFDSYRLSLAPGHGSIVIFRFSFLFFRLQMNTITHLKHFLSN